MKIYYFIFIGILIAAPHLFGEGLKDANWHATPPEESYSAPSEEAVNLSRTREVQWFDALVRQSIVSIQNRLDNIKENLGGNKKISPQDIMFLHQVAKHQSLGKYIDNDLWKFIEGVNANWAKDLVKQYRSESAKKKTEQPVDSKKDTEQILALSGIKIETGPDGEPKLVSKNRSNIPGYTGPYYSGAEKPDSNLAKTDSGFHDNSGFNVLDRQKWNRKYVEDPEDPERYDWKRKYVEDPSGGGSAANMPGSYSDNSNAIRSMASTSSEAGNSDTAELFEILNEAMSNPGKSDPKELQERFQQHIEETSARSSSGGTTGSSGGYEGSPGYRVSIHGEGSGTEDSSGGASVH